MALVEYSERSVSHLLSAHPDEDGQHSLSFSDMEEAVEDANDAERQIALVEAAGPPSKAAAVYDSDNGGFLPGFEEDGDEGAAAVEAAAAAQKIRDAADSKSMPPPKSSQKTAKRKRAAANVATKRNKKIVKEEDEDFEDDDDDDSVKDDSVDASGGSRGAAAPLDETSGDLMRIAVPSAAGTENSADAMLAFRKQMAKQMRDNGMFGEGGSVAPVTGSVGGDGGDIEVDTTMMGDEGETAAAVLNPDLMPHSFMENVLTENGDVDFDKMSALSSATKGSARISKLLKPVVDADGEANRVDNDEEGFHMEPCMLPAEFRRRDRLRRKANKRRRTAAMATLAASQGGGGGALSLLPGAEAATETALVAQQGASSALTVAPSAMALSNDIGDDHRDFDEYAQGYSHDGCLLCRRGTTGTTPIPISALDNLIKNYVANRGYKDEEDLARDLEEQFEKCVRQPANKGRKPGEKPIPPLTGEDIYYHMKYHDSDPTIFLCNSIKALQDHAEQLLHSGMYRVPRTKTRAAARGVNGSGYMNSRERYSAIKPSDVRVNEKYHKMYLDTQKQILSLYAKDPSKMFLYNKHKTIRFDETKSWINSNRPSYTDTNPKGDIWAKVNQRH